MRVLRVFLVGEYISPEYRDSVSHMLPKYHLADHRLELIQINLPKEERDLMASQISGNLIRLVEANARVSDSIARRLTNVEEFLQGFRNDSLLYAELKESLPNYFPELTYFALAQALETDFNERNIEITPKGDTVETDYKTKYYPVILVDWKKKRSTHDYERRLREAIRIKFGDDSLRVVPIEREE
jgi:hypothetical protein